MMCGLRSRRLQDPLCRLHRCLWQAALLAALACLGGMGACPRKWLLHVGSLVQMAIVCAFRLTCRLDCSQLCCIVMGSESCIGVTRVLMTSKWMFFSQDFLFFSEFDIGSCTQGAHRINTISLT